jgi:hypothetical protein
MVTDMLQRLITFAFRMMACLKYEKAYHPARYSTCLSDMPPINRLEAGFGGVYLVRRPQAKTFSMVFLQCSHTIAYGKRQFRVKLERRKTPWLRLQEGATS